MDNTNTETKKLTPAEYIRAHFSLRFESSTGFWVASNHGREISNPDRGKCVREARRQWGHMNFESEMRAFGEIFPSHLCHE